MAAPPWQTDGTRMPTAAARGCRASVSGLAFWRAGRRAWTQALQAHLNAVRFTAFAGAAVDERCKKTPNEEGSALLLRQKIHQGTDIIAGLLQREAVVVRAAVRVVAQLAPSEG